MTDRRVGNNPVDHRNYQYFYKIKDSVIYLLKNDNEKDRKVDESNFDHLLKNNDQDKVLIYHDNVDQETKLFSLDQDDNQILDEKSKDHSSGNRFLICLESDNCPNYRLAHCFSSVLDFERYLEDQGRSFKNNIKNVADGCEYLSIFDSSDAKSCVLYRLILQKSAKNDEKLQTPAIGILEDTKNEEVCRISSPKMNSNDSQMNLLTSFNAAATLMMASQQSISNLLQNSLINMNPSASAATGPLAAAAANGLLPLGFSRVLNNVAAVSIDQSIPGQSQPSTSSSTVGIPKLMPVNSSNSSGNRCQLHPEGKIAGVECPKCDLVLGSSRSLGGHITMMHSRNSCKTLKCPKCNWHYKYQETLEIHMNEKHNEAPTSCLYCATNQPHPRLGRGEQWSCGYKPYRCEVCKYSTTTKGNLAIHMQSDKHLNNVQEIQQGKLLAPVQNVGDPSSSTASSAPASSAIALLQLAAAQSRSALDSSPTINKDKNYANEVSTSNVLASCNSSMTDDNSMKNLSSCVNSVDHLISINAANLNALNGQNCTPKTPVSSNSKTMAPVTKPKSMWRCDVCNYETNVARNLRIHMTSEKHTQNVHNVQNTPNLHNFMHQRASGGKLTLNKNNNAATNGHQIFGQGVADQSSSSAFFAYNPHSMGQGETSSGEAENAAAAALAQDMQIYLLEAGADSGRIFQCCVCMAFLCDSVVEMVHHCQSVDRTKPNPSDVTINAGHYTCNLCHYKTHLKANFQLHTKTDKHLQRLQLMNHVRAGGFRNELRVSYLNPNNPIQLRCIACNEYANSLHKLQLHVASLRHKSCVATFEALGDPAGVTFIRNQCLYCTLCDFVSMDRCSMITHLHSSRHSELLNQILPIMESTYGKDENSTENLNWIEIRDNAFSMSEDSSDTNSVNDQNETLADSEEKSMNDKSTDNASSMQITCCNDDSNCNNLVEEKEKISSEVETCDSKLTCPLCQISCGTDQISLENHLSQIHKVTNEVIAQLLKMLPPVQSNGGNSNGQAASLSKLYSCYSSGCKETFATLQALKQHRQSSHTVSSHDSSFIEKCDLCGRIFKSKTALSKHEEKMHSSNLGGVVASAAKSFEFCIGENGTIDKDEALNCEQMAKLHYSDNDRIYKCEKCKLAFTKQTFLLVHNRTLQHRQCQSTVVSPTNQSKAPTAPSTPVQIREKYDDPSRPFKCEICRESFTQKNILLVHYNSVSHLNKMKKSGGSDVSVPTLHNSNAKSIKNELDVSPVVEQVKNYKCNLCKVAYASGSTLDVHLRSVAHANRANKLCELYLTGELDPKVPIIEQPDQFQRVLAQNNKNNLLFNSNTLENLSNSALFWKSMLQNCVENNYSTNNVQNNEKSLDTSKNDENSTADSNNLKKGNKLKKLLENYGFEVVMQFNETHHRKRPKSANDIDFLVENGLNSSSKNNNEVMKKLKLDIPTSPTNEKPADIVKSLSCDLPEMSKCRCSYCSKEFSSVWVLKAHVEQVHKELVPCEEVEKVSVTLKQVLDNTKKVKLETDSDVGTETQAEIAAECASPTISTSNTEAVIAAPKTPLGSPNPNKLANISQLAQSQQAAAMAMAAMNMNMANLGLHSFMGFPFAPLGLNPFMPMMMPPFDSTNFASQPQQPQQSSNFTPVKPTMSAHATPTPPVSSVPVGAVAAPASAINVINQQQPKRARTRITDDQLNVLRLYFDINNSPTEEQIDEMSKKANLPHKVIKHWFRNTLFKERQRSKDSPYNFNIPPSMGIDLEEYEKTGEAKIITLDERSGCVIPTSEVEKSKNDGNSVEKLLSPQSSANSVEKSIPQQIEQSVVENLTVKVDDKSDDSKNKMISATQIIKEEEQDSHEDNFDTETYANDDCTAFLEKQEQLRQQLAVAASLSKFQMNLQAFNNSLQQAAPQQPHSSQSSSPINKVLQQNYFSNSGGSSSSNATDFNLAIPSSANISPNSGQNGAASGANNNGSGRRANRTRFTEWQVKILQDFFETNAYPKDDDLECLSAKLNLSPRVIVVWFQNMRQKARKIYENNPPESDDRYVRTPGLNYQCKRCNLVFQRYYELIKHQKSLCYKDDAKFDIDPKTIAYMQQHQKMLEKHGEKYITNNNSLEDKLDDGYGNLLIDENYDESASHRSSVEIELQNGFKKFNGSQNHLSLDTNNNAQLFFKQLDFLSQSSTNQHELKQQQQSHFLETDLMRCPFCGSSFNTKNSLELHLTTKHGVQLSTLGFDSNSYEAEQTLEQNDPSSCNQEEFPLDLSRSIPEKQVRSSCQMNGQNLKPGTSSISEDFGYRAPSENNSCNEDDISFASFDENCSFNCDDETPPLSPSSSSAATNQTSQQQHAGGTKKSSKQSSNQSSGGGKTNHKRFRTRLTPQQIRVMKYLFKDFKTPTMSECEMLGNEMNLHKRVVQVWFQNARAKERKSRQSLGLPCDDLSSASTSLTSNNSATVIGDRKSITVSSSLIKCPLCPEVNFSAGRVNVQDHSFTKRHLDNVRRLVETLNDDDPSLSSVLGNGLSSPAPTANNRSSTSSPANAARCATADKQTGRRSAVGDSSRRQTMENLGHTIKVKQSSSPCVTALKKSHAADVDNCINNNLGASDNGDHAQPPLINNNVPLEAASSLSQNLLPYVYAAAASNPAAYYASMMLPGNLGTINNGNYFYDPNLFGTPVHLLQIPTSVMQNITSLMMQRQENFCRFTQDGKTCNDLMKCLPNQRDRAFVGEKDIDVGWACRTCNTVFQAENLFTNHQQMVCQSKIPAFKLIQIHYECRKCKQCFGTQMEFMTHCDSSEHRS